MFKIRKYIGALLLSSSLAQPAAATTVELLEQGISIGLGYFMGWGPITFENSTQETSTSQGPANAELGAEASGEYATFGEHRVKADLESSGLLDFTDEGGISPVFSAALQGSITLLAAGQLAVSQGIVPLPENFAYFEFRVFGGDAEYTLNYSRTVDSGFLRLRGIDNFVSLTFGDDVERTATLREGTYRVEAFYSLGETVSDTEPPTFPSGGFNFSMAFPLSVFEDGREPPDENNEEAEQLPLPAPFLWALGAALALVAGRQRRRC